MYCASCGAEASDGAAFCARCGRPLAIATAAPGQFARPGIITLLAVLQFIAAAGFLPVGLFAVIALAFESPREPLAIFGCAVLVAGGVFMLMTGLGLWRLKPYGRVLQIIGAIIGLLAIPLGTIVSIAILIYLNKPGIKLLFSGRAPETLTPEERAHVAATQTSGAGVIAIVVLAAVVVLIIPFIGIVAAIAIPGLLRARIAGNEASAIGTLRAYGSAETSFAQASGGQYGTPECLISPQTCLPAYSGGSFIGRELPSELIKSGYRFHFAGGRPGESALLRGFAVYAVPVSMGTGSRVFCTDARGAVVSDRATGEPPEQSEPVCPSEWRAVE
jgi:type IV pilus assembly protein PilA